LSLSRKDGIARNTPFAHLTKEKFATDVVRASAMEKGSDNELDEPQRSTIQNKFLRSARDGIDGVTNYVGFSMNPKLWANYEHVRTVKQITIK
jgi:hypothetical protein